MKNLILIASLALMLMLTGCTEIPPNEVITTHDTTITCGAGTASFTEWGVFPTVDKEVRRVFMHLTLGHPDSIAIAHWDYLDHVQIRRKGGVKGEDLDLELGRMLTPYGSNFQPNWEWEWTLDVTDYASILRDSIEVEYIHSGWEAKTVGWALNVSFEFVYGDPIANMLGYNKIYKGGYDYGNVKTPITETVAPQEFDAVEGADFARFRIQHTGHGMESTSGCSEFCSRKRYFLVDGEIIHDRDMWKECSDNALYPQGGTWIFDRADWCPGDLQKPDLIDFELTKKTHTVDVEFDEFEIKGEGRPVENMAATIFQYSAPEKSIDVAVESVLVPNKKNELQRFNPACYNSKIVVRNLGSETVTSLIVKYGTQGFETKEYKWSGVLSFYEETTIQLPGEINFVPGDNNFEVTLVTPNGKKDQWKADNTIVVPFTAPQVFPEQFIVKYKSNFKPKDNTISIVSSEGEEVYLIDSNSVAPNTVNIDTITLPKGKYHITLDDKANDGLEFWFFPNHGYGYLYLFDIEGNLLHAFESDCGQGERHAFYVDDIYDASKLEKQNVFLLYPRRIKTTTELNVTLSEPSPLTVHILSDKGEVIEEFKYENIQTELFEYDFSDYEYGRYVIQGFINGESVFKNRVGKYAPRK